MAENGTGLLAAIKRNPAVHVLFAFVFITNGLIVNGLQALTMFVWWKGDKDLYRSLNIRLAYQHWALIAFLSEWWAGLRVKLYMKPDVFKKEIDESAIIVMNHKYDIDWAIGWVLADRVKVLGNAKCMVKKQMAYMPLIGWAGVFCEYIFVTRSQEHDTKTILQSLKNLKEFKQYYWMTIYCEGTRFTEKKRKISMEVAEKKGLKQLKHHLLPRTKGFRMLTQGLRESASAVYDCTIYVKNNESPSLLELFQGKAYDVEFLCMRKPLDEVPNNDDDCATYLHELYQKKDLYFDHCVEHNKFPLSGEIKDKDLEGVVEVDCPRRPECLLVALSWCGLILSPLFYYIWSLIASGAWMHIAILTGCLLLVSFGFHKLLALTVASSSSSTYGSGNEKKEK